MTYTCHSWTFVTYSPLAIESYLKNGYFRAKCARKQWNGLLKILQLAAQRWKVEPFYMMKSDSTGKLGPVEVIL